MHSNTRTNNANSTSPVSPAASLPYLRSQPDGALLLALRVQSRASHTELAGQHEEALRLRLTTPPIDGKANKAVIAYLAKLFRLPKSALSIQSGELSRNKYIRIQGLDEGEAQRVLQAALGEAKS